MNLLEETKLFLRRYNLRPKKKLGQNFVVDEAAVRRQVEYANIESKDVVLEVGAGIGTLTKLLIKKASKVYVVEKDPSMVEILKERFENAKNLEILFEDVLGLELPGFNKTVSNIPYSISSPLTFKLFKHGFEKAVVTYQKEFADRLTAKPGERDYSRISVATYYYAEARILEVLPPEAFYPKPRVSSAVLELTPKKPPFPVNEDFFFKVTAGLFTHRGKTLKKALFHSLNAIFNKSIGKDERRSIIAKTVDTKLLKKRVFQLSPEEIAGISNFLYIFEYGNDLC